MKAWTLAAALAAVFAAPAAAQPLSPDKQAFRDLYEELVETNTTLSAGDCTLAAQRVAARMKAAGFPAADLHVLVEPSHPKEGNLVAVLPGSDPKLGAVLLLAHIDVVEARREDWTRDPFTLVEEDGYFYARGAADDKAQAAIWADALIRLKQAGFKPRRTIKMALTCGEETNSAFNGATWLVQQHRPLVDAAFALNEGAGGRLDGAGKASALGVQAGEKVYQDFTLEATNPGGHSSRPVAENAIYDLAAALKKVEAYDFPAELNDVVRQSYVALAPIVGGETGAAMAALVKDPKDAKALAILRADPNYNNRLRTTCVATQLAAGHAPNALPQRARANVNCRMAPTSSTEETRAALIAAIGDPKVSVTPVAPLGKRAPVPPLSPQIMGPIRKVAGKMWPGVPIVPDMAAGYTDGRALNAAGIPTYGVSGLFFESDGGGAHGLNERVRVKSVYDSRDFLYDLVKEYAMQRG